MARAYGGILGCLAFTTVLARGVIEQASLASTIPIACACLFGFTALGYLIGRIAEGIVAESVQEPRRDGQGSESASRIPPL